MCRNSAIITLTILLVMVAILRGDSAKVKKLKPLRDGFVLTGVDGKLTGEKQPKSSGPKTAGKWFFALESGVSDDIGTIEAGQKVEMLPSAGLENMAAELSEHPQGTFRLYGAIVTQYKGRNFIFSNYFLAIGEESEPNVEAKPEDEKKPAINEPNDEFMVPQEVIDKLSSKSIIRTDHLKKQVKLERDYVLADRTGRLVKGADGQLIFTFDTLGRNIGQLSLKALPCRELERAEREQSRQADPIRFRIAGIVTKYNGQHYILLQKATRVYSHGNFY